MHQIADISQQALDYSRIEEAIQYLKANFRQRPALNDVADLVHLSPFHFQRLFKEWAGVTPKQFMQFLSAEYAKCLLKESGATLSDVAYDTGLSGTGRLHDLFIKIEGMTPGEYRAGGAGLSINYSFCDSPFGRILIASTSKGICYTAFADEDDETAFKLLHNHFPNAAYHAHQDALQQSALCIFNADWSRPDELKLHLKGTPFQLRVWETLLKIPMGGLTTYGRIAAAMGHAKASRAVGSAVGDNPVAFLIPCHRVIRSTGETGKYHWGASRKQAMIGWEASRTFNVTP